MKKFLIFIVLFLTLSFNANAREYTDKDVTPCTSDHSLLCDSAGQPITGDVSMSFPNAGSVKAQAKDGKIHGYMKEFYPNGNLKGEMTFENGIPNGPVKTYYEDGTLETTGTYKNAKKDGLSVKYYKDGLVSKIIFKEDMPVMRKTYYPNGNLKTELPFAGGMPNGMAKTYDENGKLISVQEFKDGEPVK